MTTAHGTQHGRRPSVEGTGTAGSGLGVRPAANPEPVLSEAAGRDTSKPQRVGARDVVRIVRTGQDFGPFRMVMYVCTHPRGRHELGPRYLTRSAAFAWAREQGWTVLGPQA